MSAFIIFTRERTRNLSEFETYSKKALAAMAGHAVPLLAVYGRDEVLEGPEVEGVAILEFASLVEAKEWYESPAYREARDHRFRSADYRAIIVESLRVKG
jgi:uncharacterized protein (DUF1330 family)